MLDRIVLMLVLFACWVRLGYTETDTVRLIFNVDVYLFSTARAVLMKIIITFSLQLLTNTPHIGHRLCSHPPLLIQGET